MSFFAEDRVPGSIGLATEISLLGGGVGGLTAAHELIKRGFQVEVYERKPVMGGKARSIPVIGSGTGGRRDLRASTVSVLSLVSTISSGLLNRGINRNGFVAVGGLTVWNVVEYQGRIRP